MGDYRRYLAEHLPKSDAKNKSAAFYSEAWKVAQESLKATHPTRLGMHFPVDTMAFATFPLVDYVRISTELFSLSV